MRSDNRIPKTDAIFSLAKALGCSIEYLMTGEEPPGENYSPIVREIADHIADMDKTAQSIVYDMVMALPTRRTTSATSEDEKKKA